jgi:hypothetical protein
MPGWLSSCGASLVVSLSILPRQLTFLSGQLLDASSDCTEGEQRFA